MPYKNKNTDLMYDFNDKHGVVLEFFSLNAFDALFSLNTLNTFVSLKTFDAFNFSLTTNLH